MRVHLFPCSDKAAREHYSNTVEKFVSKATIAAFSEQPNPVFYLPNDYFACWGVTNGENNRNLKKWEKMQRGDVCLMYRDKAFFSAGKITAKFKNQDLAEHLWQKKSDGESWGKHGPHRRSEKNQYSNREFYQPHGIQEKVFGSGIYDLRGGYF